jgi:hypothetical protein
MVRGVDGRIGVVLRQVNYARSITPGQLPGNRVSQQPCLPMVLQPIVRSPGHAFPQIPFDRRLVR